MTLEVDIDPGPRADVREFDLAALELRDELLLLDVASVERPEATPPDGTRAVGDVILGTLIVTATKDLVDQVVAAVSRWVSSRRSSSVTLTLDGDTLTIDNAAPADQRQLVELFVRRHAGRVA